VLLIDFDFDFSSGSFCNWYISGLRVLIKSLFFFKNTVCKVVVLFLFADDVWEGARKIKDGMMRFNSLSPGTN
jgi:hypothetical protein